jgi:formylglycine-generating enzyme required for sulfatase activity/class 3 adenylate cyclase
MSAESDTILINNGQRRLLAILLADMVGFSRLMGSDEEGTLARMRRNQREIIEPAIAEHYGRLVNAPGDSWLAVFESPLEAVRCALVIQQAVNARNVALPRTSWIQYRIGVNLGDVIVDASEGAVYGDGVNVAARIESKAEPGGVLISGGVYEQIKNKLVCGYQSLGDEKLKNITDPVHIYRVLPDPASVARARRRHAPGVMTALLATGAAAACVAAYPAVLGHRSVADLVLSPFRGAAGPSGPQTGPAAEAHAQRSGWKQPTALAAAANGAASSRPAAVPEAGGSLPPNPPRETTVPGSVQPVAEQKRREASPPGSAAGQRGFRDCEFCPELVEIPNGKFQMGSREDAAEQPVHEVAVRRFALARVPVSVGEWRRCFEAQACGFMPAGPDNAPARGISWNDAQQYVSWLSRTSGERYRLPSEAEWEYAARGGTSSRYWWGDAMLPKMVNCRGCGEPYDTNAPLGVGSAAANPFGLFDMGGGISQWVADCWHATYQAAPSDGTPWEAPGCRDRVLRSGSWRTGADAVRPASRTGYEAAIRHPSHGFRVARSF